MQQILIVEDEPKISSLLADYLTQSGYGVHQLHEGTNACEWVKDHAPDLVLLDLMLPGKDGLTICREIRDFSDIPVIMLTARVEEIDRLIGLEIGADDYICKPFSPREVVARVKTVLKRSAPPQSATQPTAHPASPLQLDESRLEVTLFESQIALTAIEVNLLHLLASDPGRVFSRNQLIDKIYRDHRIVSERTIDSHIKKLRKKLNDARPDSDMVQSVYSVGYKLVL